MGAPGHLLDFGAVYAAMPTPMLVLSADLVIVDVNPAHLRATRRERDDVVGRHLFDAFPGDPDDPGPAALRASMEQVLATGRPHELRDQRFDLAVPGPAGTVHEPRIWHVTNTPVLAPDGTVRCILHTAQDITPAHHARAEPANSQERLRALVEHAADLILVLDADRRVLFRSAAGFDPVAEAPAADLRWGDLTHPEDAAVALGLFARVRAARNGQTLREQFRLADRGAGVRWVDVHATNHLDHPAIGGIVINARDITEQRRAERLLAEQAVRDPLTGLPNRRWFLDALTRATARASRTGRLVGVLLADIDDFKLVNDTLGHGAGDRLLVELSRRVAAALRPSDTVARLGGDELVVLAEDLAGERDALAVAERVVAAASGRYDLGAPLRPRITLSMGVSTAAGETEPDALLSHADAALYEAKRRGRDRIQLFSSSLRRGLMARLHAEQELDQAIGTDELVLFWQPIVRPRDWSIVAAEALVRWRHPGRGLLSAAEFLPAARSAGLMPRLCAWVLAHAVAQAAAWRDLPVPPQVFVNLSPQELADPSLPENLAALTALHEVPPGRVRVEVSERMLAGQVDTTRERLGELRDRGFGIALDDFGAGNTALAWLQQLPIDLLKLDRRFSAGIAEPTTQAIVASLVQLATALGIASLAEGIQTEEQLARLTELGCDYTQGFLLGRPQAAGDLTARLMSA